MNEQKVSEERLVELIDDERLGLNYLMNECISGEPDPDARTMCQDKLSALRELLTLRQSASGEIEALEFAIEDNDGWIKCGIDSLADPEWASACANPEQVRSEEREGIALRQRHATTLRQMAARMK